MEEALNELQRLGNIPDQINMLMGLLVILGLLCLIILIATLIIAGGLDKIKKQNMALKDELLRTQQRIDTIIMNIGKH